MSIVYVLINEAMPGLVKIGRTDTDLEGRMRQLDGTGVPLPFECFRASRVVDAVFVEKRLHEAFADKRIRPNREFFDVDPQQVASALQLAELEDVTPKDDVLTEPTDKAALDNARKMRSAFNFQMVDIAPGSLLTFSKDENATATVIDKKYIEFEGELPAYQPQP
jgi:hypothetical protein